MKHPFELEAEADQAGDFFAWQPAHDEALCCRNEQMAALLEMRRLEE